MAGQSVARDLEFVAIGVGDGATAVFRQILQHFGVDEADLLRETSTAILSGVSHRDWRRKGHQHDGPNDAPRLVVVEALRAQKAKPAEEGC
jgi:tryptophan halogenase